MKMVVSPVRQKAFGPLMNMTRNLFITHKKMASFPIPPLLRTSERVGTKARKSKDGPLVVSNPMFVALINSI